MIYSTHNSESASAKTKRLVATGKQYFVPNYRPREMILDRGEGSTVFDIEGNDYIDLGSGIAVCGLGHQQQELKAAAVEQIDKLWHTSNIFYTEPPVLLAEALAKAAPFAERVYLCNSGAEANEAAIKLARKYAADQGRDVDHREIVTFKGSFHGRTLATVTATAQPKYHEGFEPLPPGFVYCDYFNDEEKLRACYADGTCCISEKTCAIMVEPVQGEGGVMPAKPGFLKALREICDEVGALLIVDEIQCGMMRTGEIFAHMYDDIKPDVMTLAKALGGGLPIGAMLVGDKAGETLQFGSHGSTFGGNPVMAAVALKSLELLQSEEVQANVSAREAQLRAALEALNEKYDCFDEVRGRGLMIGAQLNEKYHGRAADISELSRKAGVLVLVAGPNVCRFLPPLSITEAEMTEGLARFDKALETLLKTGTSLAGGGSSTKMGRFFRKLFRFGRG